MPLDDHPAIRPQRISLEGRLVSIVPLDPLTHAGSLWDLIRDPRHDPLWEYLFDGPFRERAAFEAALAAKAASDDPLFFAIVDGVSGFATGYAAYLRIEPAHRVIEVGGILFAPALQRTAGATEAMYLMARHVFEDLGYRRYEWKCDSRNEPSRRAALRLGFSFEGLFRQHMIVKQRSRDTAWFSMLDGEWPERKARFERWLAPSNFDAAGRQRSSLGGGTPESDVTGLRGARV
jgi:RimJ/RimL family protein N-acetyltransferase